MFWFPVYSPKRINHGWLQCNGKGDKGEKGTDWPQQGLYRENQNAKPITSSMVHANG
ncbi:hypothetical protein RESH_02126 [Rhodopirellula europaea SH398]|uniref:Uncharacterized protein n=1 Tax=Rhodopirellula europaea SH398 TaxID=1263868 RepID=M5S736_9BACT|nr:hypothetical protein RESH_02126 [Rhodopirellula europaea SH398]